MPTKVRAIRHLEFLPDSFDAGSNQVSNIKVGRYTFWERAYQFLNVFALAPWLLQGLEIANITKSLKLKKHTVLGSVYDWQFTLFLKSEYFKFMSYFMVYRVH